MNRKEKTASKVIEQAVAKARERTKAETENRKQELLDDLDILAVEIENTAHFVGDILCEYTEEIKLDTAYYVLGKIRVLHNVLLDKIFREQKELRKIVDKLYHINEKEN